MVINTIHTRIYILTNQDRNYKIERKNTKKNKSVSSKESNINNLTIENSIQRYIALYV